MQLLGHIFKHFLQKSFTNAINVSLTNPREIGAISSSLFTQNPIFYYAIQFGNT